MSANSVLLHLIIYLCTKNINYISGDRNWSLSWIFSPGLKAGKPKYGQEAHLKASPK